MEDTISTPTFSSTVLVFVASTRLGQFFIKKIDAVLQTLEQPAKHCVAGNSKVDNRELPWPVFWAVLISLQIFRVIFSLIWVQFNKDPIEPKDVVKNIQIWRRTLRSIRFEGLRKIREGQSENKEANVRSSLPLKQSPKKHSSAETLDYNLLEELMNRTFSDTDDLDSTFTISRNDDVSMNVSWNEESVSEDGQSPLKSRNGAQKSQLDTSPIASTSKSDRQRSHLSSNENSFDEFMRTRTDSTSSLNEESRSKFENKSKLYSTTQSSHGNRNRSFKSESDEPYDPADVVISKLVKMQKDGQTNFRINSQFQQANRKNSKSQNDVKLVGVKKRKNTVKHTVEVGNREHPIKDTKSQETKSGESVQKQN